jgi:hypothetical protein
VSGAYTDTPNGRVRWHVAPYYDECQDENCPKRHATKADLDAWDDAIEMTGR